MRYKNKKKLIGVTTSSNNHYIFYLLIKLNLWLAGAKSCRLHPHKKVELNKFSAFVISGGEDINPHLYGQENTHSIHINNERDCFEKIVIQHALQHNKPLLGICRGAQMINIQKGGTLHQNVSSTYEGFIPTTSFWSKAFLRRAIHLFKNTKISKIFHPLKEVSVNSIHHQSINKLGQDLKVSAKDTLGVIQAIEHQTNQAPFILGVQWHPELLLFQKKHRKIFKTFVNATRKHHV